MSKIAVVYWSGTGNTEQMANAVAEGAKEAGAAVPPRPAADLSPPQGAGFDANALSGKKLALFGSYGWGDGEWMRTWEDTCRSDGAVLACESVICCEAPEDDALAQCKKLGATLAG